MMKIFRFIPIIFLSLFFLQSCASNSDWAKRISWDELEFANLPDQSDYPDDGAVILFDEGKMETFGSAEAGFSEFERHRIIKVLNVRGRKYANVVIPYTTGSEIKQLQARTISPEGNISTLKKENIFDVNLYPNFIFYSDQRAKIFTFPSVEDGSILEYKYNVVVGSRTLWHGWSFQSDIPTKLTRFILKKPKHWPLNYKVYGTELLPDSTVYPTSVKSTYVWELKDMLPLKSEFGMPSRNDVVAQITVAPVWSKSWDDVTKWYHELASPQMKASKDLKNFVLELTKDAQNDRDKLQLISEWVRDRVRYIAVSIGIGGFKPHPANQIFSNQYGDCKDMTTLMCTMAREVGIPANPVIVSTWQNGIPDTSLPTPFQFNHAIGYFPTVGENGTWIDATDKGCPFGQLPWYDQGLPMLVVEENGEAKIITTPKSTPENNRSKINWTVNLRSSGGASVKGKTSYWGASAGDLRESIIYSSKDAQRQWLETLLAKQCSGANLESFEISGLQPIQDPLEITYSFQTKTFTIPREKEVVFKPQSISFLQLPDYFRSPSRTHPIRFNFGFKNEMNLTIKLPNNWQVKTETFSDSLKSSFGSVSQNWTIESDEFRVKSHSVIFGDEISAEDYEDFKSFLDMMRKKDLKDVIFEKVR